MNRHERVRRFLLRHLPGLGSVPRLRDDDDIFQMGYVTSIFTMQILMFIEHEFSLVVESEDMDVSNFNSVDHIVEFVCRKKAA